MTRFTSKDGLLSSTDPKAVDLWESITAEQERAERTWTEILRAAGVKLAHPDDGWVKRDRGTFGLSWYACFNDNPQVGDLIAFGTPPRDGVEHYRSRRDVWRGRKDDYARERMRRLEGQPESAADGYRICRVTEVDDRSGILGRIVTYHYEDTGARMPARQPKKWWRRS